MMWYQFGSNVQLAVLAFATAFATALALTPVVMVAARAHGLVARPSLERWHKQPTALFGGVAIFGALLVSTLLFMPLQTRFIGLGAGIAIIFVVGLIDDRRPLRPATKFIAQVIAACVFVSIFYGTLEQPSFVGLVPLAIVWIVGITNAFNLLDNMDGLSAGVAMLVALLMALQAAVFGNLAVAAGALIVAGAAAGFLVYNFNPARIFMGDCGSMTLGFALACLALMGQSGLFSGNLFAALLLPTLIFATPLFDTTFVSLLRLANGRPISQGGRDHTSHRLVMLGLSERYAVCWLYGITLWFGLIALWGSLTNNILAAVALTILSAVALLILGLFLAEVQVYSKTEVEPESFHQQIRGRKTVISRVILHKRRFVEALLDFCLVCACLIAAYWLRFDDEFNQYSQQLNVMIPYVAACQMAALYAVGLYRGLWRYMTVSDAQVAAQGVLLGTITAYMLLRFASPLPAVPHSPLIIYMLLMVASLIGMRMGMKSLRHNFARHQRPDRKRALIVGAGDAGELTVRELFNNKSLQLQPVGFLDDDPTKRQTAIHGVRVVGSNSQLKKMAEELGVEEIIIAMPSAGNGAVQDVIRNCRALGLSYREVSGIVPKVGVPPSGQTPA